MRIPNPLVVRLRRLSLKQLLVTAFAAVLIGLLILGPPLIDRVFNY